MRSYGVRHTDIPELVDKAAKTSSMKGNPIPMTAEDLIAVRAL